MSCHSLRQRYEEEKKKGALTYGVVSGIYHDLEGSVAAHKAEVENLTKKDGDPQQIQDLQGHIAEG
ncbi:MAG: hypothetical protein PHN17_09955, partial [Syntrophaceticus sp.]|nr:hypothetical protein [Syntrophaceticus sp.]